MKVLLLIDYLGSGGAQRQFVGLASMLRHCGYDVLTAGYYEDNFYLPYLQQNDIKFHLIKDAQKPSTRIWKVRKFFEEEKPDVVIAYLDTPSIIACLCKLLGCNFRLIVSERNTTQQIKLKEKIKFFLYRWADAVVPNSITQEVFINKHFSFLKNKVHTITNFIDTDIFKYSPPVDNKLLRMVCVGRITPQKNIPNLLKALHIIKQKDVELRVDWFGRSDNQEAQKVMLEDIEKYQLQDIFFVHNETKNITQEYAQADFFCLPSLYEGFPNVLCEAMCCGKPVICSNVCDNPHIVVDGENGYVFEPTEPSDIASAIMKMVEMPNEERKVMGEKNHERIIELCSKDTFIRAYKALLN